MKKNSTKLIFILLFIYTFLILFFTNANSDYVWNYGFCYNFAKGLKMYKDFNMVITPLYPFINGLIMKITWNNIFIFTLTNTFIVMFIYYLIYKNFKKVFLPFIIIFNLYLIPSYNLLSIIFLFILFILEDKKKNDYLIGIFLGLIFLTKSSFIVLTLCSICYIKDFKKILKRFIGFIIPNLLFILYFYLNKSLYDYINYAFLGLFDFANNNTRLTIGLIICIIEIIILITLYIKKKDIKILYILTFQIMSYPLFNTAHIYYSTLPIVFYLLLNTNKNYNNIKMLYLFLIVPFVPITITLFSNNYTFGTNALKYKYLNINELNIANNIKNNVDNLNNTYFVVYDSYYYKLLLDIDINKYDILLNGNMGYNGSKNTIKYFNKLPNDTLFLMDDHFVEGQFSLELYNYIKDNYKVIKVFNGFKLYKK